MPEPRIDRLSKLSSGESESLFFKAADFLNRTNSATMGAVSEGLAGRDPIAAAMQGIKGEHTYGGQDVMAQLLGGSPDDKMNRRLGLAADILNPLDPLNYVGVGGLTKAGKAAKLLSGADEALGLAKGIGAQTKAGQRGLLTFMGTRVPLPGDDAIMGALGRTGGKLSESKPGQGLKLLFGGKRGYLEAYTGTKTAGETIDSFEHAQRTTNLYKAQQTQLINTARANVRAKEMDAFRKFADGTGKNEAQVMEEAIRFIGSGPGADRRRKAVEAYRAWQGLYKAEAQKLGVNAGVGSFADAGQQNFLSRMYKLKPGGGTFSGETTGDIIELAGASNNRMNLSLVPDVLQPIDKVTLTDAGKLEFDRLGGQAHFERMRRDDPKGYVRFLDKNRLSIDDMDAMLRGQGGRLETNVPNIMAAMGSQLGRNINTQNFIDDLSARGLTKSWDELADAERAKYVKIDQGKYASKPLAVPQQYDDALDRFMKVAMPSPNQALTGQLLNAILPAKLQNLGLMSWMKGMMIYGGGPFGYFSRNLASGALKNRMEGMGAGEFARLYPQALDVIKDSLTGKPLSQMLSVDPTGAYAHGFWTSKYGTKWSMKRIMEEYIRRNFHGGGDPMPEIVQGFDNASTAMREKIFGGLHKTNWRIEMLNRLPLMLHSLEQTEGAFRKFGKPIPGIVGTIAESGDNVADFADMALVNAREAVIRAHFDYNDLTPFERELRDGWIPFYSWMRKNIPHESLNMMQQSGQYMPFVRAYYNSFEQQGVTPEDLPEWAQTSFATPIEKDEDERMRWLDWTGFLPMLDVAELGQAAATGLGIARPQTGKTPQSEMLRYIATRMNPFITTAVEQTLQKDVFTGRSFNQDTPESVLGLTVGADKKNLLELLRPVTELDRLNPGDVFGKTPRPHRNEPGQAERILRSLTGVKVRATDRDEASMSFNERKRQIQQLRRNEQRELRAGNTAGAQFIRERRLKLEKGLR